MTRIQSYDRQYGGNGPAVRISIAKVAAAARWRDQAKLDKERERHANFMRNLP
jgi:hypothetical protein